MHRAIASTFYVGLIPQRLRGSDAGAGTFGAAVGAAVAGALLALDAPWWTVLAVAGGVTLLSLWSAVPFAAGGKDPGWVCIDETAGTLVAVIGLGGWPWVAAVVVARLADIFKVLPGVAAAERLPGTWGVTADDIVAGVYGLGVGWVLVWVGV